MSNSDRLPYLREHKPHFGEYRFVSLRDVGMGDIITFNYVGEEPYKRNAGRATQSGYEQTRYVFVLDPLYKGKLHGLTLGLTPRSVLIRDVINPMYQYSDPLSLYYAKVREMVQNWDSYRTYNIEKIHPPVRRISYFLKNKPVFKDGIRIE